MVIGQRLRELRESKNLSQGHIEKRTGLLRCYISRVENGHTVPAVDTLGKLARALEIPMYRLFYEGKEPPEKLKLPPIETAEWGTKGSEAGELRSLAKLLSRMKKKDQNLLLGLAQRMAGRPRTKRARVTARD
jgi:transcriptional regulator with XRE-family HTH domain